MAKNVIKYNQQALNLLRSVWDPSLVRGSGLHVIDNHEPLQTRKRLLVHCLLETLRRTEHVVFQPR